VILSPEQQRPNNKRLRHLAQKNAQFWHLPRLRVFLFCGIFPTKLPEIFKPLIHKELHILKKIFCKLLRFKGLQVEKKGLM